MELDLLMLKFLGKSQRGESRESQEGEGLQAAPASKRPSSLGRDPVVPAQKQSSHGQNKDLEADASVNGDLAYD